MPSDVMRFVGLLAVVTVVITFVVFFSYLAWLKYTPPEDRK